MIKEQIFIKKDTLENWNKATNFIPKENEIIIYTDINQKKIGNGKNKLIELPFINYSSYLIDENTLIINTLPDEGDELLNG